MFLHGSTKPLLTETFIKGLRVVSSFNYRQKYIKWLGTSARLIADLLAQPPLPTELPEPLSSSSESDPLLRILIWCLPRPPQQFEAFFFTACLPQLSLLLLHELEHSSSLR